MEVKKDMATAASQTSFCAKEGQSQGACTCVMNGLIEDEEKGQTEDSVQGEMLDTQEASTP